MELVCQPHSLQGLYPKAPAASLCFDQNGQPEVRGRALEAIGAAPTGSALDQSLGNVIATFRLQNSSRILHSQELQRCNSVDSTETAVEITAQSKNHPTATGIPFNL